MAETKLKDLTELSPKERVKLYIKDAHYRKFLKQSILTDYERQTILLPDYETRKEYRKLSGIYQKTPLLIGAITEAYLRFKQDNEALKTKLFLLRINLHYAFLTKASLYIKDIVEKQLTNDLNQRWEVLIKTSEEFLNKYDFKKIVKETSDLVISNFYRACNFISLQKIVERINRELGFNVFEGKPYKETFKNYVKDVLLSIKNYNEELNQLYLHLKEISDTINPEDKRIDLLKNFTIPEQKLTYKTNLYKEWSKILFKDSEED